jgi:hypothetical protein
MSKQWVLEWSNKQNAFHVQPAINSMESNLNKLISGGRCDYITVFIGTQDACHEVAANYRHYLKSREDKRARGMR